MLQNRTVHERQFKLVAQKWEHDLQDFRTFEGHHRLRPEVHGELRFAVDEWPSWRYLISVEMRKDGTAKGAIWAEPYDGKGVTYDRQFELEPHETHLFLKTFDHKVEGFLGDGVPCTDGTGFQFERWKATKLYSGSGNAACEKHYAELMSVLAETLAFHLRDAPFDWRSWFWSKRSLALSGGGS